MLSYAILLLILFGGMFLIDTTNNKNKIRNQLIYAGIVITLFWGSVDAVKFSTDVFNYYRNASNAIGTNFESYIINSPLEVGYAAFIWIVTNTFKTPQALLFVQTAFVTFSVFRFFYRNSKDVITSVIAYICLGCFGMFSYAYRQAFAIAICLFAFECIQKKKYVLSIILILFATLFHQTAIIFLPVIFIQNIKSSKRNILLFSAFMISIALMLDTLLPKANEFFEMNYGKNESEFSNIGGIINIIIFLIGFFFIYIKYRHSPTNNKNNEFKNLSPIIFLCIIGFVLYACRFYTLAMERVAYYFLPAFCILFAEGLTNYNKKRIPDLFLLFMLLSVCLFLYRSTNSLGNYSSIWW